MTRQGDSSAERPDPSVTEFLDYLTYERAMQREHARRVPPRPRSRYGAFLRESGFAELPRRGGRPARHLHRPAEAQGMEPPQVARRTASRASASTPTLCARACSRRTRPTACGRRSGARTSRAFSRSTRSRRPRRDRADGSRGPARSRHSGAALRLRPPRLRARWACARAMSISREASCAASAEGNKEQCRAHRRGRRPDAVRPLPARRAPPTPARSAPLGSLSERPRRASDQAGSRSHPHPDPPPGRHAGQGQRPHLSALVRDAPPRRGRGPAQRAGDARTRERRDDAGLHPRHRRALARGLPRDSPAGARGQRRSRSPSSFDGCGAARPVAGSDEGGS